MMRDLLEDLELIDMLGEAKKPKLYDWKPEMLGQRGVARFETASTPQMMEDRLKDLIKEAVMVASGKHWTTDRNDVLDKAVKLLIKEYKSFLRDEPVDYEQLYFGGKLGESDDSGKAKMAIKQLMGKVAYDLKNDISDVEFKKLKSMVPVTPYSDSETTVAELKKLPGGASLEVHNWSKDGKSGLGWTLWVNHRKKAEGSAEYSDGIGKLSKPLVAALKAVYGDPDE